METRSHHYKIECLGGDAIRISGHPQFCPNPVPAHLGGSLAEGGTLETGLIGRGMRLIFVMDNERPVTTSKVLSVQVEEPRGMTMSSSSVY